MYICIYICMYICISTLGLRNSIKPNSLHTDKDAVINCVKILSFSGPYLSVFYMLCKSKYLVGIREVTYQKKFRTWKLFT